MVQVEVGVFVFGDVFCPTGGGGGDLVGNGPVFAWF